MTLKTVTLACAALLAPAFAAFAAPEQATPATAPKAEPKTEQKVEQKSIWIYDDFAAALAKAKAENKFIIVDFTGSDWCGWCIRLDKEVFDTPFFIEKAPAKYVLLKLDFPRKKEQSAEIKEANKALSKKYGIEGFPTILILDAKGEKVAQTGYAPGGPEKYLKQLDSLSELKAKLAAADALTGLEQAKAYAAILEDIPEDDLYENHGARIKAIVKADADGAAGLKAKFWIKQGKLELSESLQKAGKAQDGQAIVAAINTFIENYKPTGEDLQEAIMIRSSIKFQALGDKDGAMEDLRAIIAIDKDSQGGKMAENILQRLEAARKPQPPEAPDAPGAPAAPEAPKAPEAPAPSAK